MKDKMASDHQKSIKIDPGNLWNRFLFCNTFLLHVRYLHIGRRDKLTSHTPHNNSSAQSP